MKGFFITIKNELLDAKHLKAMGESVWLYMWLIDHMTSIDEKQVGLVLGGKPIKYKDVRAELGISQDTYTRWVQRLEKYPYITITRTPYGIVFRVLKAHKRFRKNAESDSAHLRRGIREHAESNKTVSVDKNSISPNDKRSGTIKSKKGKNMGKINSYDESRSSDSYEPAIDADTGEPIRGGSVSQNANKKFWELLRWAEGRRGAKFFHQTVKKQFKAFSIAKKNNLKPVDLKGRWIEFETDKFWMGKGFDWMDVVLSFNKRPAGK